MPAMNRVTLMGNLARDPQIRETSGGTIVGNFTLAMNERYKTRQGEDREDVCFADIEVWGRQAEACGQYLSKGAPALVEGRLRNSRWEDKQTGQTRTSLRVRADRVQFLNLGERKPPTSQADSQPQYAQI